MPRVPEFTLILERIAAGEERAKADLLDLVYDQLKKTAQNQMAGERKGHTLSATALVHDVFIAIFGSTEAPSFESSAHFFNAVATAMRCHLVDHARARAAQKRGGAGIGAEKQAAWGRVPLAEVADVADLTHRADPEDVLALEDAMQQLEAHDSDLAEVVRLRFYAGLRIAQIAEVKGLKESAVKDRLRLGRAWLAAKLGVAPQ